MANSVPQTAQVKRSEAKFAPVPRRRPRSWKPIEGTKLQYVVNTSQPIIVVGTPVEILRRAERRVVRRQEPERPVARRDAVPADIYAIPASSPLHYVTYVKIYDSKPEQVIVGYTPGYTGAYVINGCVVYGTGYYYPPWIGTYWYGPPYTYGFGVSIAYTPWAGWHVGFGFGWTWGAQRSRSAGAGAHIPGGAVTVGAAYYPYVYRPRGAAWGPRGGMARGDPATGPARPATCITDGARRPPSRGAPAATTRGPAIGGRDRRAGL